ncbi:MAG: molecular chaperone HtpG [Opitutales bacterium]|nr:molecular chaperone HtpG [Opitutales bacterium]
MSKKQPKKQEFQAEVRQILDIVINSLYKDREIFVRELISNASDALEKLRHLQITEKKIQDDNLELEINVTTDDQAGTLTIQDFGVGMTADELVENLGTIAHSGSKEFLEALQTDGTQNEALIGQFGVGFYSSFMVADEVTVYTHSWKQGETGQKWVSDGSEYQLEESEGQRRGAKIVVKLKEEHKEFAGADRVKGIIQRYSSFVPFPVNLNGEKVNVVEALWLRKASGIKNEEYLEFYKFQANAFDEPQFKLHFQSDAPLAINALLFTPKENMERFGIRRETAGVALHCRKVLIEAEPKGLFPEWLRYLRGVVDSADLPLNVSRETMQDSALIRKLNQVLTKRYLKSLRDKAKKRPEEYETFWKQFGNHLKEGAATDFEHRENVAKLLRYESSFADKGKLAGLEEYVSRMPEEQKEIYYLCGPSREAIESGPYLEAFKACSREVLFLYEQPLDEYVMQQLGEFDGKKVVSGDSENIDLGETKEVKSSKRLSKKDSKALCKWVKETLGDRVTDVESSDRLVDSPACVLNADKMGSAGMRRMMKAMGQDENLPPAAVKLQLNPAHPMVRNLATLRESDGELAGLVAEQALDNALAAAQLLDDPRDMIARSYQLLERVTQS